MLIFEFFYFVILIEESVTLACRFYNEAGCDLLLLTSTYSLNHARPAASFMFVVEALLVIQSRDEHFYSHHCVIKPCINCFIKEVRLILI